MTAAPPPSPVCGPTLIVGATGFIGQFVTEAFLATASTKTKPTYLLVQPGPASPSKAKIIKSLRDQGAIIVHGSIKDQDFMEKLLKELAIEVVVSAIGGGSILDQLVLVQALKAVGSTVKRFLPSEFGHDMDRTEPVEPGLSMYNEKRKVRKAIEEAGIPYTYVCCNSIAAWPYHANHHPADVLPPFDRFQIYGDGTIKAYFVAGSDIGKFTVKCSRDIRTLNKTVHFRPSKNLLNMNELAALWEKKIGRTLPRVTITEDDLLATANEMRFPESVVAAITHDIFINGCQISFSMDKPTDAEVSSLYPDIPFRSIDDCFDDFVPKLVGGISTTAVVNGLTTPDGMAMQNSMRKALAVTFE